MQQAALKANWLTFIVFGAISLLIGWLGFALTGSLGIALLAALVIVAAGVLVMRANAAWVRVLGITVALIAVAFFIYAAVVFYLNYG